MTEETKEPGDSKRELFRHTLATLAYRGEKAISGAPADFATFQAGENSRTPVEIVAHLADLIAWSHLMSKGDNSWPGSTVSSWDEEKSRFFSVLEAFDSYLASDAKLEFPIEKLFQGPIADALTHVGQIAILRRLAGSPIRGENYVKALIVAGRVGSDQSSDRFEFD